MDEFRSVLGREPVPPRFADHSFPLGGTPIGLHRVSLLFARTASLLPNREPPAPEDDEFRSVLGREPVASSPGLSLLGQLRDSRFPPHEAVSGAEGKELKTRFRAPAGTTESCLLVRQTEEESPSSLQLERKQTLEIPTFSRVWGRGGRDLVPEPWPGPPRWVFSYGFLWVSRVSSLLSLFKRDPLLLSASLSLGESLHFRTDLVAQFSFLTNFGTDLVPRHSDFRVPH